MTRRRAPHLPERLEVVHLTVLVPAKVEHNVLERACVSVAQHETVPVPPIRIPRRVLPPCAAGRTRRPQQVGHRRAPHGGAGVARVSFLDHVSGEASDGVDALELKAGARVGRGLGLLWVDLLLLRRWLHFRLDRVHHLPFLWSSRFVPWCLCSVLVCGLFLGRQSLREQGKTVKKNSTRTESG